LCLPPADSTASFVHAGSLGAVCATTAFIANVKLGDDHTVGSALAADSKNARLGSTVTFEAVPADGAMLVVTAGSLAVASVSFPRWTTGALIVAKRARFP